MKTSRSHSAAPHADRAAKEEHTKRRASGEFPPEIPKRVCEQTGKRIPAARLKGVPWTRFREEVEARLESTGEITPPHLGMFAPCATNRSRRKRTAGGGTEPVSPTEQPTET